MDMRCWFISYTRFFWFSETMSGFDDSKLETKYSVFMEWKTNFQDAALTLLFYWTTAINYEKSFVWDMLSNLVQSVELDGGRNWSCHYGTFYFILCRGGPAWIMAEIVPYCGELYEGHCGLGVGIWGLGTRGILCGGCDRPLCRWCWILVSVRNSIKVYV